MEKYLLHDQSTNISWDKLTNDLLNIIDIEYTKDIKEIEKKRRIGYCWII